MKLKIVEVDGKQYAEVQDGKPVYVHDDGKDVAFDAPSAISKISALNAEAKGHREAKEAAERKLKGFDGIEDAAAALKALETVKNLDAKKLIDAGEVEKVKAEISRAFEGQLAEANGKLQTLEQQLYGEKIGGAFSRSKVIAEKFAIPADLVQARFGSAFKVEDGKTVAYDGNGNKIYSRARPGELADFDEALETLVEQYPYRDQILKGTGSGGSGAPAGNGGNGGGGSKSMNRASFDALDPTARIEHINAGGTVTD